MNVQELINILEKLPRSSMVVVEGYEGGVCEVQEVTDEVIYLNVNKDSSIFGPHELDEPHSRYYEDGYEAANAVYIK